MAADFSILRLEVSDTTFLHNSALGSTGGGVSIVTKCSHFYSFEPELATLLISDSVFANNTAIHGGGLNIRSEHSYVITCVKSRFTTVIQDTAFTDNAAIYSSSAMSFSISSIQTPNYKKCTLSQKSNKCDNFAFFLRTFGQVGGFCDCQYSKCYNNKLLIL